MTLTRTRRLAGAGWIALLVCSGCSDPEVDAVRDAPVALQDAGREPRAQVGSATAGTVEQSVELTVKMSMGVDYGGQSIPAETMPAVSTTLEFQPGQPSEAGGGFACRFEIAGASIVDYGSDMERLAQVNRELTQQDPVGLAGTLARSRSGHVRAIDFEIPPASTTILRHFLANLKQALQQLSVPFPGEPIGPGARWKVSLPVEISGLELTQAGTYELQRIEGDRLSVAITANLLAEPQLFQFPNMPAGSRCELIELNGRASGTLTVDPLHPFPVLGRLEYGFDMRLRVQSEGQTSQLDSRVEMSFDVRTP